MKYFLNILISLSILLGVTSCADDNVGGSIVDTKVAVVSDSTFTITGESVRTPVVQSRTINQLLGVIKAENYGELRSEVVTQFMPAAKIDDEGMSEDLIDSMRLTMFVRAATGFTGDSLVPMRTNVYRLNKQLPYPIYSDFRADGYYSKSDLLGSAPYSASDLGQSFIVKNQHVVYDSYGNVDYFIREVHVGLPIEFGQELFRTYKSKPDIFKNPELFAQYFPGVYISNSFGTGRVMNFYDTEVEMLFRRKLKDVKGNDSIVHDSIAYLAATPEIVTNNMIEYTPDNALVERIQKGEDLIIAPVGYDVEVNFPIRDIINKYDILDEKGVLQVINTLSFEIPIEKIKNDYGIEPPKNLLLIRKKDKDEFFAKNELDDDKKAFLATYDDVKRCYSFDYMRDYVIEVYNDIDGPKPEDEEMVLIAVDVITESSAESNNYYAYYGYGDTSSSAITTKISPAVSAPMMVKLRLDKAKIKFTYSRQEARK